MNTAEMVAFAKGKASLDVGCGRDKIPGAIGIDLVMVGATDVQHDLGQFPYPLGDNSFEVIFLRNVIEHVPDVVRLMDELHRVARPGADILITTPHFSSVYSYQDPTHLRHLSYESMEYFTRGTRHSNFYTNRFYEIIERRIDFGRSFPFSMVARALFALSARKYEKHFAFIFPANSIFFHLRVVK